MKPKSHLPVILLCVLFLFSPFLLRVLSGQFTIAPNTTLAIAENTEVHFDCTVLNFGIIDNQGAVFVSGDWLNAADYIPGSGSVVLNGHTQTLDHNGQDFHTLGISADEINVISGVAINGTLTLDRGIVTPVPDAIVLVRQEAVIAYASENAYINGALYHEGTGLKFYPVGKGGHYQPALLLSIQGNELVTGIETFDSNPSTNCGPNIRKVTAELYWQLLPLSGSFEGSPVELDIRYGISDLSGDLVIAQADSFGGIYTSIGNLNRDNSHLISELQLTGSFFSVAEVEYNPVRIMNIITPNGDGINDVLYIKNIELYPDNEVIILNRAGTKIFTTTSYSNTWDAKIDGRYLADGEYICIVKIRGYDEVFTQMISVLR